MTQELVSRIPNEDELAAEYRGIGFDAFKSLSDEQLEDIFEQRRQEAKARIDQELADLKKGVPGPTEFPPEFWDHVDETNVFLNFVRWRKYGIPDRNMTIDELMQRTGDVVRAHRNANPEFGVLKPKEFRKLTANQKAVISGICQYMVRMRDPFEPLTLDDYSLYNTIGLNKRDINSMLQHKVLEQLGSAGLAGSAYLLSQPYTDHLLARAFVKSEPASK